MSGKTFVLSCLFLFAAVCGGYYLAVDHLAVPDRSIDRSYKQFLLKASHSIGKRIIIDGGSNATHGIDASMIERHFGLLTVNIADNGSYPLEHKIENLANHLNHNDVVIFSLEWGQYVYDDKMPENYVDSVLDKYGSNSFYYRGLPLADKLEFVFRHLPFSLAIDRILELNAVPSRNDRLEKSEESSLKEFYGFINRDVRGSSRKNEPDPEKDKNATEMTCDEYLMRVSMENGYRLSSRFRKNMRLLEEVAEETGARFIFTWPVAVGKHANECYTSRNVRDNITDYTNRIVEGLEKHGLTMLGDVFQSRFDSTCYLDTYYHIRHDCAVARTTQLVRQLESAGIDKNPDYSPKMVRDKITGYLDRVNLDRIEFMRPNHRVEAENLGRFIFFRSGWRRPGKSGVWSAGDESILVLKAGDIMVSGIRVSGDYAHMNKRTEVWINNKYMGSFNMESETFDVVDLPAVNGLYNLRFVHTSPVSAQGGRKRVNFRLNSMELASEH